MRNVCLMLSVLLLLSVLPAPCQAGNKELMQKWAAKKQYVRDQILEELRKQGDLPQNGTIRFEASVKTGDDGKVTTFEIESVEVFEAPAAASETTAAPAQPKPAGQAKGGAGVIREESIDFAQTAPGAPCAGASGKFTGKTRKVAVHGRLTEGILDIPGTAVISDAIVLEDGQPAGLEPAPQQEPASKAQEPGSEIQAPGDKPEAPENTREVGDEKTEKSWWKIW